MKRRYQLILIGTFFIGSNLSLLEGRGSGPGQGNAPAEPTGFRPCSEWPASDQTGETYYTKIRVAQEKKFSKKKSSSAHMTQKSQKQLRQEELQKQIMKDLEPAIRKEVQEELEEEEIKKERRESRQNS